MDTEERKALREDKKKSRSKKSGVSKYAGRAESFIGFYVENVWGLTRSQRKKARQLLRELDRDAGRRHYCDCSVHDECWICVNAPSHYFMRRMGLSHDAFEEDWEEEDWKKEQRRMAKAEKKAEKKAEEEEAEQQRMAQAEKKKEEEAKPVV